VAAAAAAAWYPSALRAQHHRDVQSFNNEARMQQQLEVTGSLAATDAWCIT
jgi:hypothetical protein